MGVPEGTDLADVADRAVYIGSPEHKNLPSFAGPPKLRADASCCPRDLATKQDLVTEWLKEAIRRGVVGGHWEGGFPRYVWFMYEDTVFEGRLVNREAGWYKGYPLNSSEWPAGVEGAYD